MQENKPVLIVGLGNPGAEYERTRHNVGFMAVRALAGADAVWRSEHFAKTTRTDIDGRRVIFAMPQTYMNDSGRAVRAIMDFYKIPLENLTVIHDDMDLATGTVRVKVGGGSAGHNGIKSIDAAVGPEYRRIRIGIDHPRNFGMPIDPTDWVLGRFSDEQMSQIMKTISGINLSELV
jgi:PTH1 family peptidyl-tRNA hydrolase